MEPMLKPINAQSEIFFNGIIIWLLSIINRFMTFDGTDGIGPINSYNPLKKLWVQTLRGFKSKSVN